MTTDESIASRKLTYILLSFLIVFTSFEYFFREGRITLLFMISTIGYTILKGIKFRENRSILFFLIFLILFSVLHLFKGNGINTLISSIIINTGTCFIAIICAKDFTHCYNRIIFVIACTSLFFWTISLIPEIKDFFIYRIAPNCQSLNNEIAINEGGGINIIIYNFQNTWINELIGISRNCGPFWEPGMFAVYLIVGLFFYNFSPLYRIKGFNMILIISLISTVSTGGLISGLLLGGLYVLGPQVSLKLKILLIPTLLTIGTFTLKLDYIGAKTYEQLENDNEGSDSSRFGAMKTHIKMALNSPLIGGEKIGNYTRGKTLASGTILPFVNYGIIGGVIFFTIMLLSYIKLFAYQPKGLLYSIYLFVVIMTLSISQTILLMPFFICLIFIGLYTHTQPKLKIL